MAVGEILKRGTIELIVLALLKEEDMYGYQICKAAEKKSSGQFNLKLGTLYPSLYRLLEKGLVSERQEKVGARRVRTYYHLEEAGEKYFEEIKDEFFKLNRGILAILHVESLEEMN